MPICSSRIESAGALWRVLALATAVLASACGGGEADDKDDPPPASTEYNVNAAYRNWLEAPSRWTVSGEGSDKVLYELRLSTSNPGSGIFPPTFETTSRSVLFSELRANGNLSANDVATTHYLTTGLVPIGVAYVDGTCDEAITEGTLPTATKASTSGLIAIDDRLSTCASDALSRGRSNRAWSVEIDGSIALFCQNTTRFNSAGTRIGSDETCIETTAAGVLGSKAKVRIVRPGTTEFTLTAKNY